MVKKHRKFNYNKNLKKAWKKEKAKRQPKISDDTLKSAWSLTKSIEGNYTDMGLTTDANKALRIPKTKTLLKPEVMDIEQVDRSVIVRFNILNNFFYQAIELENQTLKKQNITKPSVIQTLEDEASKPVQKSFNHNENDKL